MSASISAFLRSSFRSGSSSPTAIFANEAATFSLRAAVRAGKSASESATISGSSALMRSSSGLNFLRVRSLGVPKIFSKMALTMKEAPV